ncbi:arsenate reductase (glutaredoxin) [Vibrio caribbeanicus]|uniref:arsenate reductase (glutaredoxin) n=1 Tax=Vibrio caribbeanicus TaxID=701175 RepID=UPI002284D3DD|nr:arsenate reductase (glutaredoxin) [Vibrio caribbeanicus]MCY9846233.1 arsenate reductase (glutaredoxin) [Vibrio caribbeanicus]
MSVDIYHNPRCSKSRQTLEILIQRNITPRVIKYLETPPNIDELKSLMVKLDITQVREMMRTKEVLYKELGLASADDETLLKAIAAHPKLLERPIVVSNNKAKLGRPPEQVIEIL